VIGWYTFRLVSAFVWGIHRETKTTGPKWGN